MRDKSRVRQWAILSVAVGLSLGVALSFLPRADASRNSVGVYSLPTGNVTPRTAITAAWANTTFGDMASEMSNSLDRQGRGAMLAPLQLSSGTGSAPAVTFSSELGSGLYRAGAGDIRMQVLGGTAQRWTSTGIIAPSGINVSNSILNAAGVTSAGNGFGRGGDFTGGPTGGGLKGIGGSGGAYEGVWGVGGPGGPGVVGTGGAGGGPGVSGTGGGSGAGGTFIGGATNGVGVGGYGTGTGAGGTFSNGTAATASARQVALAVTNGDLSFTGVANPNTSTAAANVLTPKNFIKAWALVLSNSSASPTILDGFNISSISGTSSAAVVTFAVPFANSNYTCTVTANSGQYSGAAVVVSPSVVNIMLVASGGAMDWTVTSSTRANVICVGAQ
jgi:hypothetical protein